MQPVLFIDDSWPEPPKGSSQESLFEPGTLYEIKKARLQALLASHPWGIPSLALSNAYKKMFGHELDLEELGFDNLSDMIFQLNDTFAVQEADETTALMFPDYPNDRILHDARQVCDFDSITNCVEDIDYKSADPFTLISYAWINRDDEFPPDVVMPGEQYSEMILPMTTKSVAGTRGLYQAVMVGAANPDYFHVNIKTLAFERVTNLSVDVQNYFKDLGRKTIAMYSVPNEFIYPGFPVLVYLKKEKCWERGSIMAKSKGGNKVLVEAVDYGGFHSVSPSNLYLMPKVFFEMPKQNVPLSMIGLKPSDATNKWPAEVGERMRCFSDHKYWLDVLLLEPKKVEKDQALEENSTASVSSGSESNGMKSSSSDFALGTESANIRSSKYKRRRDDVQFEAIVYDRNDSFLDVALDDILIMENYAIPDNNRAEEVATLHQKFKEALAEVPRPTNPLESK